MVVIGLMETRLNESKFFIMHLFMNVQSLFSAMLKKEDQIFICITYLFFNQWVNQVNFLVTLNITILWKINKVQQNAVFWKFLGALYPAPLHPYEDSALNLLGVTTGHLLFSVILKQGNNFFKDHGWQGLNFFCLTIYQTQAPFPCKYWKVL